MLTLERTAESLSRPLVVIVDGINTAGVLGSVGRAVDTILRQAAAPALRFVLVIRTPPAPDLSGYPLLAASLFRPSNGASHTTALWSPSTAPRAWEQEQQPGETAFADLPAHLQDLVRLPMFMSLLREGAVAVPLRKASPYLLVDQCVRAIVDRSVHDVDEVVRILGDAAGAGLGRRLPLARQWFPLAAVPETFPVPPELAQRTPSGRVEFSHDLVREYFAASRLVQVASDPGRSRLGDVISKLSDAADTSAIAAGLLRFFVMAVDEATPAALSAIALAPSLAGTTTLARLLDVATDGSRFTTPDVLRSCARACTGNPASLPVVRALLRQPSLPAALGSDWRSWLSGALHDHGSKVWSDVAQHVEAHFDGAAAAQFVQEADLNAPDVAAFLANHLNLFITPDDHGGLVARLLNHVDWRVRAAVATGLSHMDPAAPAMTRGFEHLVADRDYKVRATSSQLLRTAPDDVVAGVLPTLLDDDVWYVRAQALESLARRADPDDLVRAALARCRSQEAWRHAPRYARDLLDRLSLLCDNPAKVEQAVVPHAVVPLLREIRTGAVAPPPERTALLADLASRSGTWLAVREGRAVAAQAARRGQPTHDLMTSAAYRRLRGGRHLQVALDVPDLDLAVAVAQSAVDAGATFMEVGDPLIKSNGVFAIETVKRAVPDALVVAEMMSSDWGRDQVENAVEHGADVVLLIGPASSASVAAACSAARRLGTSILLDAPAERHSAEWVGEMARAGIDGLVVTTNIDLGPGGREPLERARQIRAWSQLPVAVSGGFTAADPSVVTSPDWDILIAGRAVTESADPHRATAALTDLIVRTPERTP
ncbi:orotidine 5'-phosphate decarboxylase / HUMPS family protein [Myceligenerans indicum]|uniref:Orotidine 5'-phosphate decarboxylase domain-containing protein n=1 Tax=Myceligenerans indicum TaxID=2593663 RepID=A0ABS1LMX1_9MICO|nr:orotidine 5'-phosphate decarboxylase / HUMPS family protein [Myceligenerans indicum]MBL0886907.1 hypothetical protein [Myceligenerans indicum]